MARFSFHKKPLEADFALLQPESTHWRGALATSVFIREFMVIMVKDVTHRARIM